MTFRVTPSFVAKTQISTNVGAIHPFTINSLKDFVDDDKDEMGLCPVRALFEYMRRSEALGLTKDKKKLFVSLFKGKTTEISKPTISNWIKETIVTCYKLANNTQLEFTNVKAHQVRGSLLRLLSQGSFAGGPASGNLEKSQHICVFLSPGSLGRKPRRLQIRPHHSRPICSEHLDITCYKIAILNLSVLGFRIWKLYIDMYIC